MAFCENCAKADVCKNYVPRTTVTCSHYLNKDNVIGEAEWEKSSFSGKVYCSECKYHPYIEHKTKYCPNCGRQMKGAE